MTQEVYDSGGGWLLVFFLNRAPGDEWECSCVEKARKYNMSTEINTKYWHQCQQFLLLICFFSGL